MVALNYLPDELLEVIFVNLPVSDLLSCSLVCSRWRNIINSDRLWSIHYREKSDVQWDNDELATDENYTLPAFMFPTFDCDSLPPPCIWKSRFMHEAHICRNWRVGRYTSFHVMTNRPQDVIECDESVVLVLEPDDAGCSLWSIEKYPHKIGYLQFSLQFAPVNFFKLLNGVLVVLQDNLMQVFIKSPDNTFTMLYRCFFDEEKEQSDSLPSDVDLSMWYIFNPGRHLIPFEMIHRLAHNGTYFVGLLKCAEMSSVKIHVWLLRKFEKVSSFRVPYSSEEIGSVHLRIENWDLFIAYNLVRFEQKPFVINKFCLKTLKLSVKLELDSHSFMFAVSATQIFTVSEDKKTISIWKKETGELLSHVITDNRFQIFCMGCIFMNNLIFVDGKDKLNIVRTLDLNSFKCQSSIAVDFCIAMLHFIRSDLVMIEGRRRIQIWDRTTATLLHSLNYDTLLWSNPSWTKIVVRDTVHVCVLRFW